jgi:hypothetical protein
VKEALGKCSGLFSDLVLPTEAQFKSLEELVAALRPVEILTTKLCKENFNVLQVNVMRISKDLLDFRAGWSANKFCQC